MGKNYQTVSHPYNLCDFVGMGMSAFAMPYAQNGSPGFGPPLQEVGKVPFSLTAL